MCSEFLLFIKAAPRAAGRSGTRQACGLADGPGGPRRPGDDGTPDKKTASARGPDEWDAPVGRFHGWAHQHAVLGTLRTWQASPLPLPTFPGHTCTGLPGRGPVAGSRKTQSAMSQQQQCLADIT